MADPPNADLTAPPAQAELADELRRLMTRGLPAARPDDVELLLSLHAIRALALVDLPSARLAALRERIHELISGTRNELLRRLAPYAFGTYSVEEFPLRTRLEHAAASGIGRGWESLRKTHLDRLADDFAGRLLWLEERLRYNGWLDRPIDEELHDERLRQHDFYTAMAYWLNGASLDLRAALQPEATRPTTEPRAFIYSGLWRWTKYLRFAHRYDEAFLGEWALRQDSDVPIAEAIRAGYDAEAIPPLTPVERSLLRVQLHAALHEELAPFIGALERTKRGQDILARWTAWVDACSCDPGAPDAQECSLHRFFEEAETFFQIMNDEVSEPHRTDRAARFQTLPDIFEP